MFVGYPSGKVTEHASSMKSEKKLLRAKVKKDIKTAVNAILHTKAYQPFLRAGFCKILSHEAVQYFKGKNCLKMEKSSSPSEISKLSIDELEFELQIKMLVTFQFLEAMTGARARKRKDQRRAARIKKQSIKKNLPASGQKELSLFKLRREKRCRNTVCNVASMCLRQYFPNMSKLAYRNTPLLLNGGCRSLDVDRLKMHGFTMNHSSAIQMQSKMAQEFGKDALEWKDEVENMGNMEKMMILMTEVGEKAFGEDAPSTSISDSLAETCVSHNDEIWMKCKNFINSRHVGGKTIESITSIEDFAEEISAMMLSVEAYRLFQ